MKAWIKCREQFLYRNRASGRYFVRVKVKLEGGGGMKAVWRTLKTEVYSVARLLRLRKVAEIRARAGNFKAGNLTLGECAAAYLQTKREQKDLKPKAFKYREETVEAWQRIVTDFDELPAVTVTKALCIEWMRVVRLKFKSASRYNGMLQTLKGILGVAVGARCLDENPVRSTVGSGIPMAGELRHARAVRKEPPVYSFDQMDLLFGELDRRRSKAKWLCRFLYHFTLRVDTARQLRPGMVNRRLLKFEIPGEIVKGGRQGEVVRVPIFPEMLELLAELDAEFGAEREWLLPIDGCRKVLRAACEHIKLPVLTHHTFRHIFITHALLKGVDVRTLAEWVNHKDGGALLLRTYSHILNEMSDAQAASLRLRNGPEERIHVLNTKAAAKR